MDEEASQECTGVGADLDEEEVLGNKRARGKGKMVIDDDDDDEVDEKEEERDLTNRPDSDTDRDPEDSQEVQQSRDGKEAVQEERCTNQNFDETSQDSPALLQFNKDIFDAESDEEDHPLSEKKKIDKMDSGSSSDEEDDKDGDGGNSESNMDSGNDDGFDEEQLDPELLQKLKKLKGASKSTKDREKYARKAKPTTDQMLELHSESQRLVRDSRVNLPYYEPEEKSLDDFLARVSRKRQEYATLKRATDYQKAQIIQEKLSVTPPRLTPVTRSTRKIGRNSSQQSQELATAKTTAAVTDAGVDLCTPTVQHQYQELTSAAVIEVGADSGLASGVDLTSTAQQQSQASTVVLQDDELPDLHPTPSKQLNESLSPPASTLMTNYPEKEESCNPLLQTLSIKINESGAIDTEHIQDPKLILKVNNLDETKIGQEEVPSLQKDPSRDLFSSQCMSGQDSEPTINESPVITHSTDCLTQQTLVTSSHTDTTSALSTDNIPSLTPSSSITANTSTDLTVLKEADTTPASKIQRKSLLDKLQQQGLVIPPEPTLRGTPRDVICLDECETQTTSSKNPGVIHLMSRLAQHNKKKVSKPAYDVNISIVEKEEAEGQQELKLKSVKYHVQPEEELTTSDGSIGSKLVKLKQQLSVGMKKKREEARQRRIELYNIENEEGFEGVQGDEQVEEEEEEAEMTDDEDGDSEEDEEENLNIGYHDLDSEDDGEDYNPLVDTEAQEDEDDDDEEKETTSNFNEDSNDFHLSFEVSDEEDEEKVEEENSNHTGMEDKDRLKRKKGRPTAVLSDEEDDAERKHKMESYEDENTSQSLWSNDMTPLSKHLEDSQPQDKGRQLSSCSPDLYSTAPPVEEEEMSAGPNSNNDSYSQGCFNTQSQLLDADGYLKVSQTQRPPKSRIAMLAQSPTDDTEGFGSSMSIGQIFGGATSQHTLNNNKDEDEENMRELMGLCSGKFKSEVEEESLPSSQTRLNSTQSFEARGGFEDDGDAYDPFRILSQDENAQDFVSLKKKSPLSDSEDQEEKKSREEEDDDDDELEDNSDGCESDAEEPHIFKGFKQKKRGIRREFLEEEAELSGSEFDSDENLDLAEEDDILEEEEGDRDMAGVSERKLRDQVGRLHMKQLQDDDDREIMRYKEMYLQDGDLYTDGKGRRRNFRWKDMDTNSQQDMFTNESDEEQVEEDPEETTWRKDRFERDKFLEDSENQSSGEDSQLVKLGQGFIQKKDSFTLPSQEILAPSKGKQDTRDQKKFKLPNKGSFLTRSKDALVKIAKMAKFALGGNVKNSRGFVFTSLHDKQTQEEELSNASVQQASKRKAHTPNQPEQTAKKLKLSSPPAAPAAPPERPNMKRKTSILSMLD